ncbi:HAMP domain-containing histidine kinase [Sulfurimonas lithotrophica]|uniref:histidine kinase n=1 Tax=Sulfurimonas lithotrophica TaxID=2590022 RepID=A0A5P8P257_9BACT|nr:ArsS family sensor histidine kinase [Sulfurimonas lithotrophica]QFR49823.1 HAMP domain-containing histidine kinase [Sulfurimonas lithotrophica]
MNKNSIIFSISITFIIALILILVSFFILYFASEKREQYFIQKNNFEATRVFLRAHKHRGFSQELADNLELMNFSVITDATRQKNILENKKTKYFKSPKRVRSRVLVKNMELDNSYYVYIKTPKGEYILKNHYERNIHQNIIILVFFAMFIMMTTLYITTLKKLKPLKTLKDKVQNFGDEEFDISCASDKKDEISLLANEFDRSAKKLKKLKESRNVFIRNIMHELKTPITKGKFLLELEQNEQNNKKMQKVFYRLESLINEFASIEELISAKKTLEKKEYFLDDIIDNAVDILMCDEQNVVKDFENIKINVDFKLFSIAIKNLLDNGIKYSTDKKILIKVQNKNIIFENFGDKLSYEIKRYYEPFFKGDDVKSNQSFGLGLYIVKHILDAHNFNFEYKYSEGKNIFLISF